MLRLFAISTVVVVVGWTTPSSAHMPELILMNEGNLYECKPIDVQELGMDGKLGPHGKKKFMLKKFKRLMFDETTGMLRLGKGHPPIKFTVHQIRFDIRIHAPQAIGNHHSLSLAAHEHGGSEIRINAFYIHTFNKDAVNKGGKKGKVIGENYPFYILNNLAIYTGHCERL